jgi:predicted histidine transporter YuiF (NhaC family)
MSEGLQGFCYGIGLLIVGAIVTAIVTYIKSKKFNRKKESAQVQENKEGIQQNKEDICNIKTEMSEIKELCRMQLRFSMILGEGMIQKGVNGDVKKGFERLKEEAIEKI